MKLVKESVLCLALMGLMALPGYAQGSSQSSSSGSANAQNQPAMSSQSQSGSMGQSNGAQATSKQEFIKKAAQDDMAEIQVAQLALQKSNNPQVKQLAQKLIDDHQQNQSKIKDLAQKENVQIPDKVDQKHQAKLDHLKKLDGDQFDRAFLQMQVKDHERDVREFKDKAANAQDPDVKQYASQTAPVLEQHLDMARSAMQNEKSNTSSKKGSQQTTAASTQPPK